MLALVSIRHYVSAVYTEFAELGLGTSKVKHVTAAAFQPLIFFHKNLLVLLYFTNH